MLTLDSGTLFVSSNTCTASTVKSTTLCANRLLGNFYSFLQKYCTFFFADNKTVELDLQSHKNINCKSQQPNNRFVYTFYNYLTNAYPPIHLSFSFLLLLLFAVDQRFLFLSTATQQR